MNQQQALDILKSGENVFLTGSAGTGKTYVLNQYIAYLKQRKVPVAVTASTGIASTHMNGMTIHAWSGIGIKNDVSQLDLKGLKKKKYLNDQLENTKVLIIDEISMLHKNQLDMVNEVLKFFKQELMPFGGVQVVFSGDFFQLPPIGDEPSGKKFAFMSPSWVEANLKVCYLTEQFRQDDNALNLILNEIRQGAISKKSDTNLRQAQNNSIDKDLTLTKLYTHNVDVDRINQQYLEQLGGKPKKFKATTKGNQKILESFKRSVQASENIQLKEGAKVMFVKNNPEKGYINGSMGEVIGYNSDGFPKVKLLNGKIIVTQQESWSVENEQGKNLATYLQIPLRLAWAITIHKSQGMTLDAAEIDLSKTFERGQGYVALSRLKNLKNLKLFGFNQTAIEVDALALKADNRFKELSLEAENTFTDKKELEERAKSFVEYCGGITNEKEIEKQAKKLKEKEFKKSTYELTKELIEKGLSTKKISEERGMTEGTIIGHVLKLRAQYPKLNIDYLKPKKKDLALIKKAHAEVVKSKPKDEPIKLASIVAKLGSEYTYNDVKLAMVFI